jgi:hypothetical protein
LVSIEVFLEEEQKHTASSTKKQLLSGHIFRNIATYENNNTEKAIVVLLNRNFFLTVRNFLLQLLNAYLDTTNCGELAVIPKKDRKSVYR